MVFLQSQSFLLTTKIHSESTLSAQQISSMSTQNCNLGFDSSSQTSSDTSATAQSESSTKPLPMTEPHNLVTFPSPLNMNINHKSKRKAEDSSNESNGKHLEILSSDLTNNNENKDHGTHSGSTMKEVSDDIDNIMDMETPDHIEQEKLSEGQKILSKDNTVETSISSNSDISINDCSSGELCKTVGKEENYDKGSSHEQQNFLISDGNQKVELKPTRSSTPLRIKLKNVKTTDKNKREEIKTTHSKMVHTKSDFHTICHLCENAIKLTEKDGDTILTYDGYLYTKLFVKGDNVHWVCQVQTVFNCKGALLTNVAHTKVRGGSTHCHERISSITTKSCPVASFSYMYDAEIKFAKTRQGGQKLVFAGYTYTKKCAKTNYIRWECSGRRGFSCNGTVNTNIKGQSILSFNVHTHPPTEHIYDDIIPTSSEKVTQKRKRKVNSSKEKDTLKDLVDEIERNTSKFKKSKTCRIDLSPKSNTTLKTDEDSSDVMLEKSSNSTNGNKIITKCLNKVLNSPPKKVQISLANADITFHSECVVCESSLNLFDDDNGDSILSHDGYSYSKSSLIKGILHWSCALRKNSQCKGSISTDIECRRVLSCYAHCHPHTLSGHSGFMSCPVIAQSIFTDSKIESIASGKGGIKLLVRGYTYTKKCGKLSTIRWECSRRKALKCRGSITTNIDGTKIFGFSTHSHSDMDNRSEVFKTNTKKKKDLESETLINSAAHDLKSKPKLSVGDDIDQDKLPDTVVVYCDID